MTTSQYAAEEDEDSIQYTSTGKRTYKKNAEESSFLSGGDAPMLKKLKRLSSTRVKHEPLSPKFDCEDSTDDDMVLPKETKTVTDLPGQIRAGVHKDCQKVVVYGYLTEGTHNLLFKIDPKLATKVSKFEFKSSKVRFGKVILDEEFHRENEQKSKEAIKQKIRSILGITEIPKATRSETISSDEQFASPSPSLETLASKTLQSTTQTSINNMKAYNEVRFVNQQALFLSNQLKKSIDKQTLKLDGYLVSFEKDAAAKERVNTETINHLKMEVARLKEEIKSQMSIATSQQALSDLQFKSKSQQRIIDAYMMKYGALSSRSINGEAQPQHSTANSAASSSTSGAPQATTVDLSEYTIFPPNDQNHPRLYETNFRRVTYDNKSYEERYILEEIKPIAITLPVSTHKIYVNGRSFNFTGDRKLISAPGHASDALASEDGRQYFTQWIWLRPIEENAEQFAL